MTAAGPGDVIRIDGTQMPPILAQAGAEAWRHFLEYFTAHIRNPNCCMQRHYRTFTL